MHHADSPSLRAQLLCNLLPELVCSSLPVQLLRQGIDDAGEVSLELFRVTDPRVHDDDLLPRRSSECLEPCKPEPRQPVPVLNHDVRVVVGLQQLVQLGSGLGHPGAELFDNLGDVQSLLDGPFNGPVCLRVEGFTVFRVRDAGMN